MTRRWPRRWGGGPSAPVTGHRRHGPVDEVGWWDPVDQAFAERDHLEPRDLGRGWTRVDMLGNEERRVPFGSDAASAAVEAARRARRPTALDEGSAWRRREGVLVVLRVEVFAEDGTAHREAWTTHAEACLDATWRERWAERGSTPGWIEARWVRPAERPDPLHVFAAADPAPGPASDVDWLRVEDHTGDGSTVTVYEHVTVWSGRAQATLTIRHPHHLDLDVEAAGAAAALHASLAAGPSAR